MPLPRVHAGLKRNKSESADSKSTDLLHITDSLQSQDHELQKDSGITADKLVASNTDKSNAGITSVKMDDSCVSSTPKQTVDTGTKDKSTRANLRQNLALDFEDSLGSTQSHRTRHDSVHTPKSKQSWLLRLFESKLFNMSLAISYLFNSKEQGVQVYIGKMI